MIVEVTMEFDSYLIHTFKNESVRNFLIRHERKNVCIQNLCYQIERCERQTYSIKFDANKYRMVIKEVAKMFAHAALESAMQRELSQAEKNRRIDESCRIQQIEEQFSEDQKLSKLTVSYPTT
jgi:hypothetical protein